MIIDFVLPGKPAPIGGFKVIYNHAKILKAHGHKVRLFHIDYKILSTKGYRKIANQLVFYYFDLFNEWRNYTQEFGLDSISCAKIPNHEDADFVVIASWQLLNAYVHQQLISTKKIIHVAMDFPEYMGPANEIINSWTHDVKYIAISQDLYRHIDNHRSEQSDLWYFPASVGMCQEKLHPNVRCYDFVVNTAAGKYKNQNNLIKLVNLISEKYKVICFSRTDKPPQLSPRVIYKQNSSDREIVEYYLQSCCTIAYSDFEGFGLPSFEAALRGCVLFSTKFRGNDDFWNEDLFYSLSGNDCIQDFERIESVLASLDLRKMHKATNAHINLFLSRYSDENLIHLYEEVLT